MDKSDRNAATTPERNAQGHPLWAVTVPCAAVRRDGSDGGYVQIGPYYVYAASEGLAGLAAIDMLPRRYAPDDEPWATVHVPDPRRVHDENQAERHRRRQHADADGPGSRQSARGGGQPWSDRSTPT